MAGKYAGPGPMGRATSNPKQDPSKGGSKSSTTQRGWNADAATKQRATAGDKPNVPGRVKMPTGK